MIFGKRFVTHSLTTVGGEEDPEPIKDRRKIRTKHLRKHSNRNGRSKSESRAADDIDDKDIEAKQQTRQDSRAESGLPQSQLNESTPGQARYPAGETLGTIKSLENTEHDGDLHPGYETHAAAVRKPGSEVLDAGGKTSPLQLNGPKRRPIAANLNKPLPGKRINFVTDVDANSTEVSEEDLDTERHGHEERLRQMQVKHEHQIAGINAHHAKELKNERSEFARAQRGWEERRQIVQRDHEAQLAAMEKSWLNEEKRVQTDVNPLPVQGGRSLVASESASLEFPEAESSFCSDAASQNQIKNAKNLTAFTHQNTDSEENDSRAQIDRDTELVEKEQPESVHADHQKEIKDLVGKHCKETNNVRLVPERNEQILSTNHGLVKVPSEKSRDRLEEELKERDEEIRTLTATYEAESQKLKETHQQGLEDILAAHKIVLDEMIVKLSQVETELAASQTAWDEDAQRTQGNHRVQIQKERAKHQEDSNARSEEYKRQEKKVIKEHESEIFNLRREHEASSNKISNNHSAAIASLKLINKGALDKLLHKHEIALNERSLGHAATVEKLEATLAKEKAASESKQFALKKRVEDEQQKRAQDQSAWSREKNKLDDLRLQVLSEQAARYRNDLEDAQIEFDQTLAKQSQEHNVALESKSVTISKQRKELLDGRKKWEEARLVLEHAQKNAIRTLTERHEGDQQRIKHECGKRVVRLNKEHKAEMEKAEETFMQYRMASEDRFEKTKQDAADRLKRHEEEAAATLTRHKQSAADTLKQQEQKAADTLAQQIQFNEAQQLRHDTAIASMEEKHRKASEQWQLDTTAAHAHLKAEIQARNKALIARETSKSHTDGELKSLYLGIIDDVDGLARLRWTFNRSAWTDELQKELSDAPKRLRKQILQDTIWGVLYEQVFGSPYRMLGSEGKRLEKQWLKDFGSDKSGKYTASCPGRDLSKTASKIGDGAYVWPKPSFPAERWRYETLRQLEDALKNPMSDYDPRQKLLAGFNESLDSACKEISHELEKVFDMNEKTTRTVQNLVQRAASMWVTFGAQKCRLVVAMSDLKVTTESCNPNISGDKSVELVAKPELRRIGDTDGALYDSISKISGCEGEMIQILY